MTTYASLLSVMMEDPTMGVLALGTALERHPPPRRILHE